MATNPMAPPMAEEAMESPQESAGERYIEICIKPDGSFEVSEETKDYEMAEEQGAQAAGMEKEPGQTFASVDEVLEAVRGMLGGQESGEPKMPGEDELLQQGFNQVRGTPAQQGMK